jgi:hypothetical protein
VLMAQVSRILVGGLVDVKAAHRLVDSFEGERPVLGEQDRSRTLVQAEPIRTPATRAANAVELAALTEL